jgi:hypothetical protein
MNQAAENVVTLSTEWPVGEHRIRIQIFVVVDLFLPTLTILLIQKIIANV